MASLRARARRLARCTALLLTLAPLFVSLNGATARTPSRPDLRSLETRLSVGITSTGAEAAYRRGATGQGVTVAMIDTGVGSVAPGTFGALSPDSIDLIGGRDEADPLADHGAETAMLLGAALDGKSTVGIAYGATLLAIRADYAGSCRKQCAVRSIDLAHGIDYALAHGARIIGVPLVGPRPLPTIEPALARAVAAGAIIVAAAGNDGADTLSWPARYAADPRFAKNIIVAGATDWQGRFVTWSSRPAEAADRYILAPGLDMPVHCAKDMCRLVSGTSYSVPIVAGALSLLLSRHPELDGPMAAAILLDSASKRVGAPGRGLVNVGRAIRLADRAAAGSQAG
jgi:subtilisin family serine protease